MVMHGLKQTTKFTQQTIGHVEVKPSPSLLPVLLRLSFDLDALEPVFYALPSMPSPIRAPSPQWHCLRSSHQAAAAVQLVDTRCRTCSPSSPRWTFQKHGRRGTAQVSPESFHQSRIADPAEQMPGLYLGSSRSQ